VPHSPITPIEGVAGLPFVAETTLRTVTPDGRTVRLPPPAVSTAHLEARQGALPFAPDYGEHTGAVLAEAGLSPEEIADHREKGVVA
jgi:crotonobetainyl-CoA:carnitine CoA-transferase CaiB-like acyl-CoA transferase